jgi:hypothetical protein
LRVWTDSTYTIGMQTGFTFGPLVNDYAMTFQMSSTSSRGFWWGDSIHTNAQGAMALSTDGKLTVAHSIRLGYGEADTTVPGASYRLDVLDTARISDTTFSKGAIELDQLGTGDRNSLIDFHSSGTPAQNDYSTRLIRAPGLNGDFYITNLGLGGLVFSTAGDEKMRLDSLGRLGIGTTTPTSTIHVQGIGQFADDGVGADTSPYGSFGVTRAATAGSSKSYIALTRSGNAVFAMGMSENNAFVIGAPNASQNIIQAAEYLRILLSGIVQMSAITESRLSVGGTLWGSWAQRTVTIEHTGSNQPGIGFHAPTSSTAGIMKFYGPGNRFELRNSADSGFTSIYASAFVVNSDYRLKTDVKPLENALNDIMALSPVSFTLWERDEKKRGFIAHEAQSVIPESVIGDYDAEDERGFPMYQGLETDSILATAVAAIRELKAIVDQQAVEIKLLKRNLNA